MSQTTCECVCPEFTAVPLHGISLNLDTKALKLPAGITPGPENTHLVTRNGQLVWEPIGEGSCRIRVDDHLHVYVNGNLTESGDGLTPETAVRSYEDAVRVLARYDGGNLYEAHVHFANLDDTEACYPTMIIFHSHHATFKQLCISGISHDSTILSVISAQPHSFVSFKNLCASRITAENSYIYLYGNISIKNLQDSTNGILSSRNSTIFIDGAEIYFHKGNYGNGLMSYNSHIFIRMSKFFTIGTMQINSTGGFMHTQHHGEIIINTGVDFSGCTAVIGKRYMAETLSLIATNGHTIPGTIAGTTSNGAVYV